MTAAVRFARVGPPFAKEAHSKHQLDSSELYFGLVMRAFHRGSCSVAVSALAVEFGCKFTKLERLGTLGGFVASSLTMFFAPPGLDTCGARIRPGKEEKRRCTCVSMTRSFWRSCSRRRTHRRKREFIAHIC